MALTMLFRNPTTGKAREALPFLTLLAFYEVSKASIRAVFREEASNI